MSRAVGYKSNGSTRLSGSESVGVCKWDDWWHARRHEHPLRRLAS